MKRFSIALLVLFVAFSCAQKEPETATSEGESATSRAAGDQPRQMIPDKPVAAEMHAAIKPYFDAEGTVAETSISPGESFDVYIIAEFEADESMTAAEFKLNLPQGVSIHHSAETDSATLRSGNAETDFMIAFRCTPGPKMMLMKYTCIAGNDFTGGTISTDEGARSRFLGFVTCDDPPLQVGAEKGTAALNKK
ncbi:MAG: hypothetical protein GTO51_01590 [Candidatus Latescibacteria bacterium]|nr:hypothetical protein [Candidatus Latescibacterota bacterium]NIM22119.1 hypothetical protein [Candidatus Latescibacterota bacterium]NIM64669.1 hypothetical protein [Candidatus Latescibacterota bacterium]NIO01179.1 hypothetical protein [Candidatus Latescibacterota bacterium]NIO27564.1 hypothetical protein [Candidatus Latescibacterota bacterium]